MKNTRRNFIKHAGLAAASFSLPWDFTIVEDRSGKDKKLFFDISLAEFSFAGSLYGGQLTHLDFPAKAKSLGFNHVEYVSGFWKEKPDHAGYLRELKTRSADAGTRNVLIMVDGAGNLGASDSKKRLEAIEGHRPWIDAASALGCYAIRVNLDGDGTDEEILAACLDGYSKLVEIGEKNKIAVLVENHIGPSVNPDWLVNILRQVKSKYSGALVDTSNFVRYKMESMTVEGFKNAKIIATYDKYEGVRKLMPYAKGVSAKTHQFDANNNDMETDFGRMMKIIKDAGFKGLIGVEYEGAFLKSVMGLEGNYPPEDEGVKLTKAILEKEGSKA